MARELKISIGQYSDKGRKDANQDFHGALIPGPPSSGLKGIAIALADGISSSAVGGVAAESAVKTFLTDYYCTPDTWSVKTSAQRVIAATNSWLHAQTRRSAHPHDKDKGYVCTLSVLILRSRTAHIFHAGDSRIYRLAGQSAEQLTTDHRVAASSEETWLSRALGMDTSIEIDYRAVPLEAGDVFVLTTDGVHDHIRPRAFAAMIGGDLDAAAQTIAQAALAAGSLDNLTVQIVRIDALPEAEAGEIMDHSADLPPPPLPEPRDVLDGYRIVRRLHASSRAHVFLAADTETDEVVALKVPSIDLRGDPAYLKRFMMEEWIARRIDSPHVARPPAVTRSRNYIYTVMEFIDGQTLTQWMIDNPKPDLETVRGIVEQIARGLRAFHRIEMLHQDLRPENVMIDKTGTVKLIDFGSVRVTGVSDGDAQILGTVQYTAPEYFTGQPGTSRSDLFSLGTITYQMLTGRLPYGAAMARARTGSRQAKIAYCPARAHNPEFPGWIDAVLKKAVHPDPLRRYEALSEFMYDLRHPNASLTGEGFVPLLQRDPLLFWKVLSCLLALVVLALLAR